MEQNTRIAVIAIIIVGIVLLTLIITTYSMWSKPYNTWTTGRLMHKAEKMTNNEQSRSLTTRRAVSDPAMCDDVCIELKSRNNCGPGENEPCICYMPTSCETLYGSSPDYLDEKEETCQGCDIISSPNTCSDRYLDRHITSANCGSDKDYTDAQCMAACESYDSDKCNNAYCEQMLPTCQPCTITSTLGCTPERLDSVLTACYAEGSQTCEQLDIDEACSELGSRNDATYKPCANTTCLALTSDARYTQLDCTDADVIAKLPASCNPKSIPCLQLCQRIDGVDTVVDPNADPIIRSKACTQEGCSSFYNTTGWNCCTAQQCDQCTRSELEDMSEDCLGRSELDLGFFTHGTIRPDRFSLISSPNTAEKLYSVFNGDTSKYKLYLSVDGGPQTDHMITNLIASNIKDAPIELGSFPITLKSTSSTPTYNVFIKTINGDAFPKPPWTIYAPRTIGKRPIDDLDNPPSDNLFAAFELSDELKNIFCMIPSTDVILSDGVRIPGFISYIQFDNITYPMSIAVANFGQIEYCTFPPYGTKCVKIADMEFTYDGVFKTVSAPIPTTATRIDPTVRTKKRRSIFNEFF
jgi:hypothetical protein